MKSLGTVPVRPAGLFAQRRRDVNALKPTGPRSPEGKAIASRNSLTHGLTAKQAVIAGEDQAEFDVMYQALVDDRNPQGELEIQLTGEIAACTWRLARARQHEGKILQVNHDLYGSGAPKLELVMRYIASIERQLQRAIVRLEYVQTTRAKAVQTQSVSQIAENSQPEPAHLVIVAGSSRPHFVSQSTDNSQSTTHNSQLTTHNSQPAAETGN